MKKKPVLSELICDTSPLQYLHQAGLLSLLPELGGHIVVPPAVVNELAAGRALGISLPDPAHLDWIRIQTPTSSAALSLVTDLGPGETGVLALALEGKDNVAVLDDDLARRVPQTLGIQFIGTLGILLQAKQIGLIPRIAPVLDELDALRFRISPVTRAAVLRRAKEI